MALVVSASLVTRRRGRSGTGRGELYPTLDLHGYTGEEAVRICRQWLHQQQRGGARAVRLITGRGNRSAGPPVLLHEVETLLRSLRPELVAGFGRDSAGGAFLVELRPYRPSPVRPSRFPWQDPELRRLAEETLHDLGVRPTPELIEAEMRRLRRRETE